jgi:hypothetical protein
MNPTKLLIALAGSLLSFSACAHAESSPAKVKAEPYELKNRSSFSASPETRAPFWPIGWRKPNASGSVASTPVAEQPKIQLKASSFNVTSILLGNPALATINGHSFGEGEHLPVRFGSQELRVVIRAIRDGGVWLQYETQQVFVPMRRAEIGTKQVEQKADPAKFTIDISK